MATPLEKLRQLGQQIKAGNNPFQTPLFKPAEAYKPSTPMPSTTPTQASTPSTVQAPKPTPMPQTASNAVKPPSQPQAPTTPKATPMPLNVTEITRKAQNNIPLTNPTPEAMAVYNQAKTQPAKSSVDTYFDKHYGGLDNYAANQNQRYAQAIAAGDADLIKRLQDDAARVGYDLIGKGLSDQQVPMPAPATNPGAFTPTPMPSDPIAAPTPTIPAMDWDAIQRYADEQIAAQLARQKSAADQAINAGQLTAEQQTAALRQAADRLRGEISEQRGVENVENARRLSPFSGRSDYALGQIERERGKTDRTLAENQQMQEANIQANLAQLRNEINAGYLALEQASPAERERIIQQLRDSERQYSLQEAQLEISRQLANSDIKNADFGRQLSTWQANRSAHEFDRSFGLQEGQLTGNYNGQRTLQGQAFDRGVYENDRDYNRGVTESDRAYDYQLSRDKVQDEQWTKAFEYQKTQDAQSQARWKAEFDYNRVMNDKKLAQDAQQFAKAQGLQWAQLSQRQKEQAAEEAWMKKQYDDDQAWKQKEFDLKLSQMTPQEAAADMDEYDMYILEDAFADAGLNLRTASPSDIKKFVANMKSQYGWTTEEATKVDKYLSSRSFNERYGGEGMIMMGIRG